MITHGYSRRGLPIFVSSMHIYLYNLSADLNVSAHTGGSPAVPGGQHLRRGSVRVWAGINPYLTGVGEFPLLVGN